MSPLYNAQTPPPALFPGYPTNQFKLFNADTLVAGQFSQQVHIPPAPIGSADCRLRFVLDFNAAPGTFELDIQEDDIDTAGAAHYAQIPSAGVINTLNSGSTTQATVDLASFQGQFLCVYVKTAPTNASITATLTVTRR